MALRSLGCASFSQDAFASGTRVALSRRLMEPMVMSFFFPNDLSDVCEFYRVLPSVTVFRTTSQVRAAEKATSHHFVVVWNRV